MKNMISFFVTVILILFFISSSAYGAQRVYSYGFEDWTGECKTTPGYPFYMCTGETGHSNGTEVIGSCGSWTPHTGSYFFFEQAYAGLSSDPCLAPGDNPETVNTHNRINIPDVTDEIFVHFYFRFNDYASSMAGGRRMKFLDLETNGLYPGDMEVWSHFSSGGSMNFIDERTLNWGSGVSWPGGVNPLRDNGKWHSYAIWAKLSTGQLKVWMDTTDWDNPTIERSGYNWYNPRDRTPATKFTYIYIHENYSADTPTQSLKFALDSIEIWDGIPDSSVGNAPNPPTGLVVISNN